jgi:hypothetical protein
MRSSLSARRVVRQSQLFHYGTDNDRRLAGRIQEESIMSRIWRFLKPYMVAVLIVSSVYIVIPYLMEKYSAHQRRLLINEIVRKTEARAEENDRADNNAFRRPAKWIGQSWVTFLNLG